METLDFWIQNNIECDPFICTPYVGSPLFYDNKDYILQQYDERLKILQNDDPDSLISIDEQTTRKWRLDALDKFMKECGNATDYTATVSQYFTIPELFALRRFMYKHDARRMLQMAHQRYQQTGLGQWKHDEKWNKYCQICKAREEITKQVTITKDSK